MGPLDKVIADAKAKIAEYGVMVTYVGGGPESVPFSYTVGLTAIGEPELMMLGDIPPKAAQGILNDLAFRVVKDGERYSPGDVPPEVLADGYDVMMCGPLLAVKLPRKYRPGIAMNIYDPHGVRVYQVVYQDSEHLYPWEGQPYLGGGRG